MKFKPGDKVVDKLNRKILTVIEGFSQEAKDTVPRYVLEGRDGTWCVSEQYLKLYFRPNESK